MLLNRILLPETIPEIMRDTQFVDFFYTIIFNDFNNDILVKPHNFINIQAISIPSKINTGKSGFIQFYARIESKHINVFMQIREEGIVIHTRFMYKFKSMDDVNDYLLEVIENYKNNNYKHIDAMSETVTFLKILN